MWTSRTPEAAGHDGNCLSMATLNFLLSLNTFFSYPRFLDFSHNSLFTSVSSGSYVPSISQFFVYTNLFCACHFSVILTFISIFLQLSSVVCIPSPPPVFLLMTWHLLAQNNNSSSIVFFIFCPHTAKYTFPCYSTYMQKLKPKNPCSVMCK